MDGASVKGVGAAVADENRLFDSHGVGVLACACNQLYGPTAALPSILGSLSGTASMIGELVR